MTFEEMKKRHKEIKERLSAIGKEYEKEDADVTALAAEVETLDEERQSLEADIAKHDDMLARIAAGLAGTVVSGGEDDGGENAPVMNREMRRTAPPSIEIDMQARKKRAEEFARTGKLELEGAQCRSLLLSTGNIATPTKVSGINDLPGVVSSIIDLVTVEDCTGMSADKVAYQVSEPSAAAVTEGNAPTTSEPTFNYVTITPGEYGLMAYISEQIRNQSPLAYEAKVVAATVKALRKKAAEKIKDAVYASALAEEITTITSIGAGTLRTIAFMYSDESMVDGNAYLFLNKADLIAFGDVRGTNEKKPVYEITADTANPNTGTIKDGGLTVKYCIMPDLTPLTGTTNSSTTATKPTMFYGNPRNIKLDLFGGMKVKTSEDYKFAEGLLSVRGVASFGTDLVVKNGLLKISLPKAE